MTQSTEVEVRRATTAGLSPALAAAGVQMETSEDGRYRALLFPPELRERFNVLLPVQSIAQADPNFTPNVRVLELDVETETYTNRAWGSKRALTKTALEKLANTAGILYTRADRIRRGDLEEGEIGYKAEIGIRRSDGAVERITRSKVWRADVERARIIAEVKRNDKITTQEAFDLEFQKRWLVELEHRDAKTESKAILRAIRAALQVRQQYTPQELAKPWLVVAYAFTPDLGDPDVKRALVAAGLNAADALYPARGELVEATGERAEIVQETSSPPDTPPPGDGEEPAGDSPGKDAGDEAAAEASEEEEPVPDADSAPDDEASAGPLFEGEEPPPPSSSFEPPAGAVAAADPGLFEIAFGRYKGQTIAQIRGTDPGYVDWLASESMKDQRIREAAQAYVAGEAA